METQVSGTDVEIDERRRAHRRMLLSYGSAVVVAGVGAAALVGSRTYPYWTPLGPGPGFFPRWLGGLLIVCGLLWLGQLVRVSRVTSAGAVVADDDAPEYSLPTVLAIVISLCLLAATLEVLGYQLAMFVFVLFHLLVLGRRRLLLSLALALLCSVGVFVAFTRFLTVPLPASSIPFLRDMGF